MDIAKCSLVTPTYNWPEALELLLLSVLNQSHLPDEVIVADDGSTENTKILIEKFQKIFPVPLVHIWHEDLQNRKPTIMNKAIAKAKFEYIIEIDGDIIMQRDFIKDHLQFAQKGLYLFGSRVTLKKETLPKMWKNKIINFGFFASGIKKRGRTLHIPFLTQFVKPVSKRSSKLRGCNMSYWREDFIRVNGFNEQLSGWGNDDSELIERFHNIGLHGKRLKFAAIAYHIYHKEQSKGHISGNHEIEKQTVELKLTTIQKGVNQYL